MATITDATNANITFGTQSSTANSFYTYMVMSHYSAFTKNLSIPLKKRLEHALSRSFKINCN